MTTSSPVVGHSFWVIVAIAFCALALSGFRSIDPDQPITVRSAYSDHVFLIPRGYFLYPPPLDGILNKSTAEAFIVDYPDFHFQSEANNRKFRQPGSPDIVMFMVHLAPTLTVRDFLKVRLETLKKSPVGYRAPGTDLVTFPAKNPSLSVEKNIYVDPSTEPNFLECYAPGSIPSPSCKMFFFWNGLGVDAKFDLSRIGERNTIKQKVINKLECWLVNAQKWDACSVE